MTSERRDAGGDVDAGDVLVGDLIKVLDDGAQGVAVRGDEYALAGEHLGANLVFEIGPGAGDRVLEALGIG